MSPPAPDHRTPGKIRLRTTIALPAILQIVGSVSLVGWLSLRSGETSIRNLAQQLRTEVIEHVRDRVGDYVEEPHLVNQNNRIALDLGMLTWANLDQAETYFRKQALAQPSIGYVGFANEQSQYLRVGWVNRLAEQPQLETAVQLQPGGGTLSFYSLSPNSGQRESLSTSVPNYDVRTRPFYEVARRENQPAWSEIYINIAYKILQINASTPYYNQVGEFDGILTCQIGLNQIGEFLQFIQEKKAGEIYIMERSGDLVASSLDTVSLLREDPNDNTTPLKRIPAHDGASPLMRASSQFLEETFGQLHSIQSSQQLDFNFEGKRNFVQVSPFQDPYGIDWLIVSVVPESDFMAEIQANQRTTLVLCLITLLATCGISLLTTHRITKPLQDLTQTAEDFNEGRFNDRAPTSFIHEFDRLGHTLNHLATQRQEALLNIENEFKQQTAVLAQEKAQLDLILTSLLPQKLVNRLKKSEKSPSNYFKETSILFVDLVSVTTLENEVAPLQLVQDLNAIFSTFDTLTEQQGLEKIKTIGNAYLVIGGTSRRLAHPTEAIADLALAIQAYIANHPLAHDRGFQVRIGINTGFLIAGRISKKKFIYDLWGDAVNIAASVEAQGTAGCIQVTEATYDRLKDNYNLEPRPPIHIKGHGSLNLYWLWGKR